MTDVGSAAALLLTGVFAWSGAVKLANLGRTASGFAAFGLPVPRVLAVAVPVTELALAVGFSTVPRPAAWAALVVLAGFSAFLVHAIRSGSPVGCGCFGSARPEPVSGVELARNALLAVAAVLATSAESPPSPGLGALALVAALAALAALALTAGSRRRRHRTVPRST